MFFFLFGSKNVDNCLNAVLRASDMKKKCAEMTRGIEKVRQLSGLTSYKNTPK